MKIAVDIDGPVAKFGDSFIDYCNMRFGYNMDFNLQDKWHISDCVQYGISKEQDKLAFQEFCDIRMFAALELQNGAKNGLCSLSGMGCEIVYITARPKTAHRTTAKWLVKMGLPLDGLIFCDEGKGEMAKLLGCQIAIDDKPENCVDFYKHQIETIVWDALYNREILEGILRFDNWKDIVRYVEEKHGTIKI